MIRVAAVGDVHFAPDAAGTLSPHFAGLADQADALLLAGDLTRDRARGRGRGARCRARLRRGAGRSPCSATTTTTGSDEAEITRTLTDAGVQVLEGESRDRRRGRLAPRHRRHQGLRRRLLRRLRHRLRRARDEGVHRLHPGRRQRARAVARGDRRRRRARSRSSTTRRSKATLVGEKLEIYPFLGSYLLAEAIDCAGADLVLHGHAHRGTEKGVTPGGIHVRNVAQPLIRHAFNLYCLDDRRVVHDPGAIGMAGKAG